eukprot:scaffold6392_cov118-Isochrysis_galbana.AAC.11
MEGCTGAVRRYCAGGCGSGGGGTRAPSGQRERGSGGSTPRATPPWSGRASGWLRQSASAVSTAAMTLQRASARTRLGSGRWQSARGARSGRWSAQRPRPAPRLPLP